MAATQRFMKFKRSCDPSKFIIQAFFFLSSESRSLLEGIWHYNLTFESLSVDNISFLEEKLSKVAFRSRLEASHFLLSGSHALFTRWGLNNAFKK